MFDKEGVAVPVPESVWAERYSILHVVLYREKS